MKTLKLSGSRGGAASAFLAVAFATLGLQGTASAQGVTSVIRGTITDASGAVVQAAALTVTDVTKGWNRMTISGTAGEFEFVQLPPADTFSIAVQAPGYKKELRSGIVLETGQKSRVDIVLSPGTVSDTVMVQGDISLVQSEDAAVGDSIVREDRNAMDLLTADYTFVDERLARHYGIPNIEGNRFRRVKVTEDYRRGLLGQASILTVTSDRKRTSPGLRSKWVLDNFLGAPPPRPPANVPPLKENSEGAVRERLEAHRANATCAGLSPDDGSESRDRRALCEGQPADLP